MSLHHNPGRDELNQFFENQRLREELSRIKIRAGQLAVDLMRKSVQLSEAEEKLKRWQSELEIAAGQKGHNLCWRDLPKLLKNTIGHTGKYPDPDGVTREEFELGCRAYQDDIFSSKKK